MISREKAINSAQAALYKTEFRLQKNPHYGVYIHARDQLTLILEKLKMDFLPESEREFVDIGIMAVKENLEESDADYADALMLADYDFKMAKFS